MSPWGPAPWRPRKGFPRVSGDEPGIIEAITVWDRFPRVSGDEPGIQAVWTGIQTFSPRERG